MEAKKADPGDTDDRVTTRQDPPGNDSPDTGCRPPSYSENPVETDLLPPETLLLAGTAIHSTSSPPSCPTPIYQLSRDISHLRQSNTKVELSRFDHRIRNNATTNTPQVSTRERHIFNLTRPPTITTPQFEYHLEPVSSGNLGHVGLKRYHHVVSSGYQAWRSTIPHAGADLEAKELVFVAKARGKERYEWREDTDCGRLLAYDTIDDGIFRLQVLEAMNRKRRDALVGVWCLRVWREVANSNVEPLHREDDDNMAAEAISTEGSPETPCTQAANGTVPAKPSAKQDSTKGSTVGDTTVEKPVLENTATEGVTPKSISTTGANIEITTQATSTMTTASITAEESSVEGGSAEKVSEKATAEETPAGETSAEKPPTLPTLRGEFSLKDALEQEENMLLRFSYPEKRVDFFVWLHLHRKEMAEIVSFHLGLSPPEECRPGEVREWLHGSFNVCILFYINNWTKGPGKRVLIRFPLPYKVGESEYPGNAEEKLRCEVATYIWMQENCPDVPIPQLWGFGFKDGQTFTKPENVPWATRLLWYLRHHISRIFRYPLSCPYVINFRKNVLENGYLILDYIDEPGVQMLSSSWEQLRQDDVKRKNLFTDLSRIMLSLSRTPLPCIGSWTLDLNGRIRLANRPLTCELHQFENEGIPTNISRELTYTTSDAYYRDMLIPHDNRIRYQPNSIHDELDGSVQLANLTIMRSAMSDIMGRDLRHGPFFFQLTDLHQSNIFVDKDWNIKYLIDLEWACSLPVERLYPPWWMTGRPVDGIVDEHLANFRETYQEFTDIFEEQEKVLAPVNGVSLSRASIMRRGLSTGSYWYLHALGSAKGLYNLFMWHIQPLYAPSHDSNLEYPAITSKYWAKDGDEAIAKKLKDKVVYEDKIRQLFDKKYPSAAQPT
ncbi:uncharacterized protein GIQ15_01144 [Arthroderma uncinatum]|uniref:uncharacterized protein n=1 Tax=Arthroderma uncinatum TaxID=74035 RepID=UPI00144AF3C6|nr:uncharacterized protein GIQ15_01144 [Arthroderma uncinatum]KAF3491627.1 hypothetical protein GIQ15_01144 [Arthroderma uncinatum]